MNAHGLTGKRTRAFEPGPPSNPRRINFYGHFQRGASAKKFRINRAHDAALIENAKRTNASPEKIKSDSYAKTADTVA